MKNKKLNIPFVNTISLYQNLSLNKSKQIIYLDLLSEESRQNLQKLINKNPKYKDLYYMIDRKNYYSTNNKQKNLHKRVFSERNLLPIHFDIDIYNENRKNKLKENQIKKIYKVIDSLERNASFDDNINIYNSQQNMIDSINIKPKYGLPIKTYSNYYDNQKKNTNEFKSINNLTKKSRNLKKLNFNSYKNKKYNLTEKGIKTWITREKYGLNEPFLINNNNDKEEKSSNYISYTNNSKINNKSKHKLNIYFSNDFYDIELENFKNNLNKIDKRYKIGKIERKINKKRLLTP